jgi:hypothetical protein
VESGLPLAGDFIFNCQMGRGRTTSGQVAASLIATTRKEHWNDLTTSPGEAFIASDGIDGPSEEEAYSQGMHLVTVNSNQN